MSQQEKEEQELEQMKKNQFHAKAVGETLPRSVEINQRSNWNRSGIQCTAIKLRHILVASIIIDLAIY